MSFVDQDTINSIQAITREIVRGYNEPQNRSRVLTSLTFKYHSGTSSDGSPNYLMLILSKDRSGQIDFAPYAEGFGRITSEVNILDLDSIINSSVPKAEMEFGIAPVIGKYGKSQIVLSRRIFAPDKRGSEVLIGAIKELETIAKSTKKLLPDYTLDNDGLLSLNINLTDFDKFKESWESQKDELIKNNSDFQNNLGSEEQLSQATGIAEQIQEQQALDAENRDPSINEGLPPSEEEI
ncbi:hypothetical protein [Algoriphagus halophilus]|uniref:Uncharacterized protein n=1 Tax=Algoriphagus halophilus TaxID=226505 RepID=A0A1N6D3X7_9BACT|nr:hypothetical protein [Algoriphagus halophilus]SIN65364.1 hypothetical protein SAMN05444394_0125 [Algoriphagus halophilus]